MTVMSEDVLNNSFMTECFTEKPFGKSKEQWEYTLPAFFGATGENAFSVSYAR